VAGSSAEKSVCIDEMAAEAVGSHAPALPGPCPACKLHQFGLGLLHSSGSHSTTLTQHCV